MTAVQRISIYKINKLSTNWYIGHDFTNLIPNNRRSTPKFYTLNLLGHAQTCLHIYIIKRDYKTIFWSIWHYQCYMHNGNAYTYTSSHCCCLWNDLIMLSVHFELLVFTIGTIISDLKPQFLHWIHKRQRPPKK